MSQITMDDVDLPRRMKGGEYVHAYYAYDVVSQCRVGLAYGRDKDEALVVACFRDMFRLIERNGWGDACRYRGGAAFDEQVQGGLPESR